ncbi:hypothetical protein EON83_01365 [bacterium]|nr:MAG: hypothetical protein EON83_01365 [bacterium]
MYFRITAASVLGGALLLGTYARAQTPTSLAKPKFVPSHPDFLYKSGETISLASPIAVPTALRWEATELDGAKVAEGTLTPAAKTPIQWTPTQPGIYYVRVERTGTGADKPELLQELRVAVLDPDLPRPRLQQNDQEPYIIGVCAHAASENGLNIDRETALMGALNMRMCRYDFNWHVVQPNGPDEWKWDVYDRLIAAFVRNRVTPESIMAYSTKWGSTGPTDTADWSDWAKAPPRIEPYTKFLTETVKRYGPTSPYKLRYWEIWNEPDIAFWKGTAEQYGELFDASMKAIKAVDPNAMIMNGGFSETRRRPTFISDWWKASKIHPDIVALHSHMDPQGLYSADSHFKSDVPDWKGQIWMNEAGYSSFRGGSERDQAQYLIKKIAISASLGHRAYLWYDLRDDGTDNNEIEHNWGLVKRDFQPKASLNAAYTCTSLLGGKRFVKALPVGDGLSALLFEGPGKNGVETTLVTWANRKNTVIPRFLVGAKSGTTTNLLGQSTAVNAKGGLLGYTISSSPQFFTLPVAATSLKDSGQLLALPTSVEVPIGATGTLSITITNRSAQPLQGTLKFQTSAWSIAPAEVPISLAAGAKDTKTVKVTAPNSGLAAQTLKITLAAPQLPQAVSAEISLRPALRAPADSGTPGDFARWKTPLVALEPRNLVGLFEATPMRELHFQGPNDLNAQIFVAHTNDELVLAVKASDDTHIQNEAITELWKGDSLQFALQAPTGQFYEWTAALTKEGPRLMQSVSPQGQPVGPRTFPLFINRDEASKTTWYELRLPAKLPGLRAALDGSASMSLLVNDNDGQGRKGWIEWTPGIGQTKDPQSYQPVSLQP